LTFEDKMDAAFALIERAALDDARCPQNGTRGMTSAHVGALCRAGRILVEISDKNYRRATILAGPNKGKRTAANPTGAKPWKIVGLETRINGKVTHGQSLYQPSAPRLLPADYFKRGRA
jgi:hypothetical protein